MKNDYVNDLYLMKDKYRRDETALLSYVMASETMPTKKAYAGIADEVFSSVREQDFYNPDLAGLFRVIKRLHAERKTADEIIDISKISQAAIDDRVERARKYRKSVSDRDLNEITGEVNKLVLATDRQAILDLPLDWKALINTVVTAAQSREAVDIVRNNVREVQLGDKLKLKEMTDKLVGVLNRQDMIGGFDPADPSNDVVDACGDICANLMKTPEERAAENLNTGFPDLDNIIEPYRKAVWIIGARASAGKTSFACDLARYSTKRGRQVAYFTMEMGKMEILKRMLCAESVLPGNILLKKNPARNLTEEEYGNLYDASSRLSNGNNLRVYEHALDIDAIEDQCRILHAQGHLDVVIIDYLQRLNDVQASGGNRYAALCDITMRLKNLAMKYNVLIYALSQFNRSKDNLDEDGYPTMACLRDSGSIEQDADGVIAIHRPPKNDAIVCADGGAEMCKLFILKNRNGAVGRIDFLFDSAHFRFGCIEDSYQESFADEPEDENDEEVEDGGVEQGELLQDYEAGNASFVAAVRRAGEKSARTGEAVPLVVDDAPAQPKKRRCRPPKNAAAKRDEPKKKKSFDELPKRVQAEIKEKQFQQACDDLASETKE